MSEQVDVTLHRAQLARTVGECTRWSIRSARTSCGSSPRRPTELRIGLRAYSVDELADLVGCW